MVPSVCVWRHKKHGERKRRHSCTNSGIRRTIIGIRRTIILKEKEKNKASTIAKSLGENYTDGALFLVFSSSCPTWDRWPCYRYILLKKNSLVCWPPATCLFLALRTLSWSHKGWNCDRSLLWSFPHSILMCRHCSHRHLTTEAARIVSTLRGPVVREWSMPLLGIGLKSWTLSPLTQWISVSNVLRPCGEGCVIYLAWCISTQGDSWCLWLCKNGSPVLRVWDRSGSKTVVGDPFCRDKPVRLLKL